MKTVLNVVLIACIGLLAYICYGSIMGPIKFDEERAKRERVVINRLIDIRKAQVEYRTANQGVYTASFDTLINFVKTQKIPYVAKEGVLSDEQLEKGMTERKAMSIINKAKQTGNWREVESEGLTNFRRDTFWVSVMDTIFPKGFNADSLRYIPFGNGAQFEMTTAVDSSSKSGVPIYLFEAKAPYEIYLNGLDHQQIVNIKDYAIKLGRYPGLQVGSIDIPNNNAGNWE